jgi:putative salt-induced outer membrane protein
VLTVFFVRYSILPPKKPRLIAVLFVILSVLVGVTGSAQETSQQAAEVHESFLSLECAVARAMHEKDRPTLEAILADEYVLRGNPDISRETWIQNALTLCWGDHSDIERFEARELGDAMVASFVSTFHRDPFTCRPATIRSLVTDVWVQRDGKWRLLVRHAGPVGETRGLEAVKQQYLKLPEPPARWEATGELSFVSTGGNARVQTLGAASDLRYRPGHWATEMKGSFVRSQAEGIENARALELQLRQSRDLPSRLQVYSRGTYRRDMFAGIEHRVSGDAGLGQRLISTPAQTLKVDIGLGYLHETRVVGDVVTSFIVNTAGDYQRKFTERVMFSATPTLTLSLEDMGDWRLLQTTAVTTDLSRLLSLKLSHRLNLVNQPVPGFRRTDTAVSAALVAKIKQ